jgi:prevent-host-death family protein
MEQKSAKDSSIIGAYEAKTHFSSLLERASQGEELTITRNGQAIVRMVPAFARSTVAERREAIATIRMLSKGHTLGGATVRDLIVKGRR